MWTGLVVHKLRGVVTPLVASRQCAVVDVGGFNTLMVIETNISDTYIIRLNYQTSKYLGCCGN